MEILMIVCTVCVSISLGFLFGLQALNSARSFIKRSEIIVNGIREENERLEKENKELKNTLWNLNGIWGC